MKLKKKMMVKEEKEVEEEVANPFIHSFIIALSLNSINYQKSIANETACYQCKNKNQWQKNKTKQKIEGKFKNTVLLMVQESFVFTNQ